MVEKLSYRRKSRVHFWAKCKVVCPNLFPFSLAKTLRLRRRAPLWRESHYPHTSLREEHLLISHEKVFLFYCFFCCLQISRTFFLLPNFGSEGPSAWWQLLLSKCRQAIEDCRCPWAMWHHFREFYPLPRPPGLWIAWLARDSYETRRASSQVQLSAFQSPRASLARLSRKP